MHDEFISLETKNITGILNPLLTLSGKVNSSEYDFKILVDGQVVNFDIVKRDNNFILTCLLEKKQKMVEVYLLIDNCEYLVYNKKNNIFVRLKSKLNYKFKNFYNILKAITITLGKGIKFFWKEYHLLVPPRLWKKYFNDFKNRIRVRGDSLFYNPYNVDDYNKWLKKYEHDEEMVELKYKPLISILIPVYNIESKYLSECIDSILNQSYSNFEICLVDDASSKKETLETLKIYETKDDRIKVHYRQENGHISRATNDALEMATGEFIGLVDNDDTLSKNALYEMVKLLNEDKSIDMIYSDEDKINLSGRRCDPNFKSDFAPDSLLSSNYICHFTILRTSIMKEIGGERVGFEGAQDYDLFLRFTEKTNNIRHIPKILYHWRMVEGSTSMVIDNKSYALERGKKALEEALERRKIKGEVKISSKCPYYYIEYDVNDAPKISIIIPTRNHADITEKCLKSIYDKTTYKNYEVILVNNQSDEKKSLELFEKYKKEHSNFKVIDANMEFNYSRINNFAINKVDSSFIVLLNNDTEVITPNWLEIMVGYAKQDHIGSVGAKLLYPDNTIQHAGIILGIGGVAAHAFIGTLKDDIVFGGRTTVPYNYSGVTAACLMIKREKFLEVNGLDEKLQVAFNDVDFNIKLLEKGYYNVLVPMVELYHYESKSRGYDITIDKYQRFVNEVNYISEKWGYLLNKDKYYNPNFSLKKSYFLDK